jgi:diacylglycerol kinase (ATP)
MAGKKQKNFNKQVKLIFNPESGNPAESTQRLGEAVLCLNELGLDVHVALAHPKEAAEKIARKAIRKGYRKIIVMGGDGTIEAVARALVGTKTRLGIIPHGTYNNVARSLGIPEDISGACHLLTGGGCQKIDVGQIKNNKGKKSYFLEIASVGLIAALFPEGKDISQGHPGNIIPVVGELIQYQTPKMTLEIQSGSHLSADSLLVTVSNTPSFGDIFLVAPDAVVNDGLLNVSFYPNTGKAELVEYFASVRGGKQISSPKIERYLVRAITIKSRPKQEAMADGIMLGKGTVKIKVRKGALRVMTAAPSVSAQPAAKENKAAEKQPALRPEPGAKIPEV